MISPERWCHDYGLSESFVFSFFLCLSWLDLTWLILSLFYVFIILHFFSLFCCPQSLLRFLGEAHRGVRGFVHDEFGNPVEGVGLKIKDRDVGFKTTRHGEYWRILLPGRYVLEVKWNIVSISLFPQPGLSTRHSALMRNTFVIVTLFYCISSGNW